MSAVIEHKVSGGNNFLLKVLTIVKVPLYIFAILSLCAAYPMIGRLLIFIGGPITLLYLMYRFPLIMVDIGIVILGGILYLLGPAMWRMITSGISTGEYIGVVFFGILLGIVVIILCVSICIAFFAHIIWFSTDRPDPYYNIVHEWRSRSEQFETNQRIEAIGAFPTKHLKSAKDWAISIMFIGIIFIIVHFVNV